CPVVGAGQPYHGGPVGRAGLSAGALSQWGADYYLPDAGHLRVLIYYFCLPVHCVASGTRVRMGETASLATSKRARGRAARRRVAPQLRGHGVPSVPDTAGDYRLQHAAHLTYAWSRSARRAAAPRP